MSITPPDILLLLWSSWIDLSAQLLCLDINLIITPLDILLLLWSSWIDLSAQLLCLGTLLSITPLRDPSSFTV